MSNVTITETVNQVNILDDENKTVEIISAGAQGASGSTSIDDDSIVEAKLDIHADPSGTNKFLGYTSNGMEWAVPPDTNTTYTVGDNGLTKNNFTDALKTKLDSVESNSTADMTGSEIKTAYEAESNTNAFTDTEKSKLAAIEASATADMTGSEIKTAYESESDTNAFTDALKTKLEGVESGSTGDMTGAEIKSAYEGESNTNAFTDTEKTKLSGIAASANNYVHPNHSGEVTSSADGATVIASNIVDEDNLKISNSPSNGTFLQYKDGTDELTWATPTDTNTTYTAGTGLNLSGTEFSVTSLALTTVQEAANESAQLSLTTQEGDVVVRTDENKTYVKNAGTAGTMADFTLLRTPTDAVLSVNGNTGAITAAQIASAVEAASDSNTFTDADHTKLNAIEASADVTDAANVNSAGAVMNSDLDGKGELLVGDGSGDPTALAVGTDGYILKADSSEATGVKWAAAGSGGDVNQNAFSNFAVSGQDTVVADSTTDTVTLVGGTNVTIATNATNDEITITSTDTNTTYSVGDNGLTKNNFTDALKTKLDGIATGAEVNVQSDWNASSGDAQILNKPTIPTNTDTTYGISCVDGDNSDEEKIRLTAGGDGSGTNDVVLEAGTGLSIARSGDKITFTNTVTDTNTQLTTEEVQDIIGAMVAGNTETNISVTYDDTNGKLDFVSTDTNTTYSVVTSSANGLAPQLPASHGGKFLKADGTWEVPPDTNTTYSVQDGQLSQNNFTDADHTKLDGIEASADVTDATNVDSAGAVMNSDLDGKGEILIGDGSGDPTALAVGTNDYVLTADSNEATGVKWAAAAGGGGLDSDSEYNTVGGTNAGSSFSGTSAVNNSLYGYNAGAAITSGDKSVAIGSEALSTVTTNSELVAVGYKALKLNTAGNNVAVGAFAGEATTSGDSNVFVGYEAGKRNTTGYGNGGVGLRAMDSVTTGIYNNSMGYEALGGLTTGNDNTGMGNQSLQAVNTGSENSALGAHAGDNITSGSNNTCLGFESDTSSSTASNEVVLGNSSVATLRCQVSSISSLSDRRDKTDIKTLDLGLDFIDSLKPVKFKWQTRDGKGPKGYEAGFIAQDFQEAQKNNDARYLNLVLESNPEKLEAAPGKLIPILVRAIQELKIEIETLRNNG